MNPAGGSPAYQTGIEATGIDADGCGALFTEENVLDVAPASPITYPFCGTGKFFANQTPAGALIQGVDTNTQTTASDLSIDVEDAAVLAF